MVLRLLSAERDAVAQHNFFGAIAFCTLLCRRCYKGTWAVTSSFAVPNFNRWATTQKNPHAVGFFSSPDAEKRPWVGRVCQYHREKTPQLTTERMQGVTEVCCEQKVDLSNSSDRAARTFFFSTAVSCKSNYLANCQKSFFRVEHFLLITIKTEST